MTPTSSVPSRGFRAEKGVSYADAERHAAKLRKRLGLSSMARIDGNDLLALLRTRLLVRVDGREYRVDYDVKDCGVEAYAAFDDAANCFVIVLGEATYSRLEQGDGRALFDLAHEAAHVVLHNRLLLRMARIPHEKARLQRNGEVHAHFMDTEWQADAMASAFLMPASAMQHLADENNGCLDPEFIRSRYGVSIAAARVRAKVFQARRTSLTKERGSASASKGGASGIRR